MQFNRAWLPLNGLRAFEATARQKSFTKAAEELFVTQSAVSRQVQRLETLLGAKLLQRSGRDLSLTAEGAQLYAAASAGFDGLSRALRDVVEIQRRQTLRVALADAFAQAFAPRLVAELNARNPELTLELDSIADPIDFDQDGYDFAIVYSRPAITHHIMDLLLSEHVAPLAAPSSAKRAETQELDELASDEALLHTRTEAGSYYGWECWARHVNRPAHLVRHGAIFNTATLSVRCALEGGGVVMTDPRLYKREIDAELLAATSNRRAATGFGYYLISRQDDLSSEAHHLFRSAAIDLFAAEQGAAAPEPTP